MFFRKKSIDYDKLAKKVYDLFIQDIESKSSNTIKEILKSQLENLDIFELKYLQSYNDNYGTTYNEYCPLIDELVSRCANSLSNDLYKLRKAEILKEIGPKKIIETLEGKLTKGIEKRIDKIMNDDIDENRSGYKRIDVL